MIANIQAFFYNYWKQNNDTVIIKSVLHLFLLFEIYRGKLISYDIYNI